MWKPSNEHNGVLGVFHAIVNILTEALRIAFDKVGINYEIKGHDLAYWVSHLVWIALGITLLYIILSGEGHPIGTFK